MKSFYELLIDRLEESVETTKYRASHNKDPKGRGLWFFELSKGNDKEDFKFNGSYADAKAAAEDEAKKKVILELQ